MKRALLLAALALAATGCGSKTKAKNLEQTTNKESAATSVQTFQLEVAEPAKRFNVTVLKAHSTRVQLILNNSTDEKHSIAIRGNGVNLKARTTGGKPNQVSLVATLKPGKYTFYDPVGGNEQKGLKGQLIVGAPA